MARSSRPKAKAEQIGQRAYARRRGVSLAAVQKAIRTGRLADSITRGQPSKRYPHGRVLIDPELADREWEANTDAALQREKKRRKGAPKAGDGPGLFDGDEDGLPEGKGDGPGTPKLADSQARRMHFQAKLARLDWEERVGELVRAARVRTHAFSVAHAVREAVLQLPDRLAGDVAAEDDTERCRLILQQELDRALQRLADAVPEMVEVEAEAS